MKPALVSHFMPIPVKRETNSCFRSLLPMTELGKRVKRDSEKIQALVSQETALISPHFMFRFTRFLLAARERSENKLCSSVSAIVSAVPRRRGFGNAYFSATGFFASSTSFSKRGSPRSGSHQGHSFSPP